MEDNVGPTSEGGRDALERCLELVGVAKVEQSREGEPETTGQEEDRQRVGEELAV